MYKGCDVAVNENLMGGIVSEDEKKDELEKNQIKCLIYSTAPMRLVA
jgi:hypothetical protein